MMQNCWLIGYGPMGKEYAKVLQALRTDFKVIRKRKETHSIPDIQIISGGIEEAKKHEQIPSHAIIATQIPYMCDIALELMSMGVKNILIEKPGSTSREKLNNLHEKSIKESAKIYIGYNRRFYGSTQSLLSRLKGRQNITSISYDISERVFKLKELDFPDETKKSWFLANSSHVIDLAFFLSGRPLKDKSIFLQSGFCDLHKGSSVFTGAGLTDLGIPFSYTGDWEAPGGWQLTVCTSTNKYIFKPLEKLSEYCREKNITKIIEETPEIDKLYKPGLYFQCKAFLGIEPSHREHLCKLEDHLRNFLIYEMMANYK